MPYEQQIEERIDALPGTAELQKNKMFGGVCYLTGGKMAYGIYKSYIIVRVGTKAAEEFLLRESHTHPFDITGKVMKAWVMVAPGGYETEDQLMAWLERGRTFAAALDR